MFILSPSLSIHASLGFPYIYSRYEVILWSMVDLPVVTPLEKQTPAAQESIWYS